MSGSTVFAGTSGGGIFRSINNGTSWTAVNSGLTYTDITSFVVSDGAIFAGTRGGGVFLSTNNGTRWTEVDSGLTNLNVLSLASSNNSIYAGISGSGVWRRPLSEMLPVSTQNPQHELSQQSSFKILPPNRSNSYVAIEFSLPHSEQTSAKIFNLSGHEIASLVNENPGSGKCRFLWNTRNIAPGCYAVRLRVGANTYIRSISVTR
jgi:hypothetical protein